MVPWRIHLVVVGVRGCVGALEGREEACDALRRVVVHPRILWRPWRAPVIWERSHDATAVSGVNFHVGWIRWRDVVARAYREGSAAAAVLEALSVCARASINSAHACAFVHCHVGRGVSEIEARFSTHPYNTNKPCHCTSIFSARLIFLVDLSGYRISPRHDIDMRRRWDTDL